MIVLKWIDSWFAQFFEAETIYAFIGSDHSYLKNMEAKRMRERKKKKKKKKKGWENERKRRRKRRIRLSQALL